MLYRVFAHKTLYSKSFNIIMARRHHCTSNELTEVKGQAIKIFDAGVESVLPDRMVKKCLSIHGNTLTVKDRSYAINHNVHVVGFGKAVLGMVRAVEDVLGYHIIGGVASAPMGIQEALRKAGKQNLLPNENSKVKLIEGAEDNLPDECALKAANEIAGIASNLSDKDILLVLVSGGGSALLPCPVPPISLEEKHKVTKALSTKGATIVELNTVRKHLSTLKGGGLAQLAYPAQVVTLVLSDIIGDPLDLIASAPTLPDPSTPEECLEIIKRLEVKDDIPKSVMKHLTEKAVGKHECRRSDFDHVMNVIVGSNTIAVKNALEEAERCGFVAMAHSMSVDGEAKTVGKMYCSLAALMYECYCVHCRDKEEKSKGAELGSSSGQMQYQQLLSLLLRTEFGVKESTLQKIQECAEKAAEKKQPLCIIGAGETTVTLVGDGKGGRNQEIALSTALAMNHSPIFQHLQQAGFELVLLSAGTDGQDGPTDAAGAFAYPGQVTSDSHAQDFLDRNDSYYFYKQLHDGKDLIITGLTGTNVMDLQILLLKPPAE